jgi:3'(2'), 5'-bisphosphate nucleotidase
MSDDPGTADAELAREIAAEAGRRLLALRRSHGSGGPGPAADERTPTLRDAADRLSHEFITAELARRRPRDAVLSEEGPASPGQPSRLAADRVWIVDPLDGTREFGEPGRTDWAVHVALWERDPLRRLPGAGEGPAGAAGGGDLTAGAVALPAQGVTLSTAGPAPGGAVTGGAVTGGAVTPGARKPLRIVVSRTRRPAIAERLAGLLGDSTGAELVPHGSAGAKVATVLAGDADAYVHEGGFYEWDTAAPAAVARSAGFHVSRLDGGPLRFNQEDVWMPDILVCPSALAGTLLGALEAARSGSVPDVPAIG